MSDTQSESTAHGEMKSLINVPDTKLDVDWVDPSEIEPNEWNPNFMTLHRRDKLVRSLLDNGWTQPIVVREDDMVIIDGEQRWSVAQREPDVNTNSELVPDDHEPGVVPIFKVDVDEVQSRLGTVLHNKARGKHDIDGLKELVADLGDRTSMDETADHLGYNSIEIDILMGVTDDSHAPDESVDPESMVSLPWDARDEQADEGDLERLEFLVTDEEHDLITDIVEQFDTLSSAIVVLCEFGLSQDIVDEKSKPDSESGEDTESEAEASDDVVDADTKDDAEDVEEESDE